MQSVDGRVLISPQDVVAEFECSHRVALTAAVRSGALDLPAESDPALELLRARGIEHERARLEALDPAWRVKRLGPAAHSAAAYEAAWVSTREAMAAEFDAIYQATLYTGDFVGIADFLILARGDDGRALRDADGRPVYEPVDTKSARSAKRGAALQVGAYAEAMIRLGLPAPSRVHLWLAGDVDWAAPAGPLIALAREYRERVAARLQQLGAVPDPAWAPPRPACGTCVFIAMCDDGRRHARDLSMVQAMRSTTRQHLVDSGIATIDALAMAPESQRPPRVSRETFDRLRAQASIQVRGQHAAPPLYEIVDRAVIEGLPPRSSQDIWFDMEGDPYAPGLNGLEYMFGFGYLRDGGFEFATTEAHDAATERIAFEEFIDEVVRRIDIDPHMHVYHYADYERRTLQRLAQQHGTRESELDRILREGRLVDLYGIVRRSLRFSTESLSLKYIEAVYGVSHSGEDVATAMDSVVQYESYIALRAQGNDAQAAAVLDGIRSYNRLDCQSTQKLDDWLRTLVPQASSASAVHLGSDPGDDEATVGDGAGDVVALLEEGLPADRAERTSEQQHRALLAAVLQFHERERRPAWWQLFDLIKAEPDELGRASDVVVIEHATAGDWVRTPRMKKHRREITVTSGQEDPRLVLDGTESAFLLYDVGPEGMARPSDSTRGYNPAHIESVSQEDVTLTERAGFDDARWEDLPIAILPGPPYNTTPMSKAIAAAASAVLPEHNGGEWVFPKAAWADLLLARAPRLSRDELPDTGRPVDDICAGLLESDDSYIAVQGPPGTGKTYLGSRVVARLAARGWRIGVVAQSHAVIDNFLEAVYQADPLIAVGKEPQGAKPVQRPWHISGRVEHWGVAQPGGYVVGGTAWTFCRAGMRDLMLDLLVIDEAGQFSLANAVAGCLAARTALLLGDPQQLPQVTQARHPEAMEASVLAHVIGGHATMPADRGYFLDETFRMHPALTRAVSRLQYEGRLTSAPVTSLRSLAGVAPGVIPIPVDHEGNTTSSVQEAEEVVRLVGDLIGRSWTGARSGVREHDRHLRASDIIVVAAYNAQVRLIHRLLADAGFPQVQVGTVDKFQGREEVVVILSMSTSSDEDLPRGIEFLLSPNRLNVAISRAQWACYLVHSPRLLDAKPASVEGLQRLGGLIQLLRAEQDSGATSA